MATFLFSLKISSVWGSSFELEYYEHEGKSSRIPFAHSHIKRHQPTPSWLNYSSSFDFLLQHKQDITQDRLNIKNPHHQIEWLMMQPLVQTEIKDMTKNKLLQFQIQYCKLYLESLKRGDLTVQNLLQIGQQNGWSPVNSLNLRELIFFVWNSNNPSWLWSLGPLILERPILQMIIEQDEIKLGGILDLTFATNNLSAFLQLMNISNLHRRFSRKDLYRSWQEAIKDRDYTKIAVFFRKVLSHSDHLERMNYLKDALSVEDALFRKTLTERFLYTLLDANKQIQMDEAFLVASKTGALDVMHQLIMVETYFPSQAYIDGAFTCAVMQNHEYIVETFLKNGFRKQNIYPSSNALKVERRRNANRV